MIDAQNTSWSRRHFLRGVVVVGTAAAGASLLAACGQPQTAAPAAQPTTTAGQAPPAGAAATTAPAAKPAGGTKLTLLTHWGDQDQLNVITPLFEDYQKQSGNTIDHQTVAFDDLLKRITTGRLGGPSPDIYHFYNLWMPDFVASDVLQAPPADIVDDVTKGYGAGTIDGVSYKNQIWGYATEVNTYLLIYNKQLFQQAGLTKAPATWDEFKNAAVKTTLKDADGKVSQSGFLFLKGWDSGVVHPWTSLLWSHGGEYAAKDYTRVLFNEQPGLETLQLEADIIKSGGADLGFQQADFVAGKCGMTIMANWWGATLRKGLPGGIENAGVAPIPIVGNGKSTTLQYNWLWGVDKNSKNGVEAWKFLKWLNSPAGGASSPMGKYLTTGLNAIPARTSDQQAYAQVLGDPFVKPFVDALQNARTEPIIPGAQEIKTTLQKQIESVWFGQTEPKSALETAAQEANRILLEKKG